MSQNFHLALLIHAHQPGGNFEHVFERAYKTSYLPFLECLEQHPRVQLGLHYTGPLLTWFEAHRPEYFELLKNLVQRGQVELVGGGFYEPILVSIPQDDQHEQIVRLADFLESHFGQRPSGAWLAERVWEPQLPSALSAAGVNYTLVDDMHFLAAGFEPEELFGYYTAEDRGRAVRLYPGQKKLRYQIPFGIVKDVITYLRESASLHPGGVAAMGDDMEKFGVWPGTFEHCYAKGWLSEFFTALEENSDWLKIVSPGQYIAGHTALGRADLPTASYSEMMEWVLPTRVRQRFHAVLGEFDARPEVQAFLRGGSWRGFFRKYSESNLLHKKMLRVSARIAAVTPRRTKSSRLSADLVEARDLLLRAQCNDVYWHGVFGGIYAPHLRTNPWRNLIRAEAIADKQDPKSSAPRIELLDYDADGANEVLFTAQDWQALLKPDDGGTIAALDFRPAGATLINSMMRRVEAYHSRLREVAVKPATGAVASIHDQIRVKEPNLERFLRYDRWPRHAFRVLIFDPSRSHSDYEALELQEDAGFAGGAFAIQSCSPVEAQLFRAEPLSLSHPPGGPASKVLLTKRFSFASVQGGFEISCEITLKFKDAPVRPIAIGIESVINFLAPAEPDRYIETPAGHANLRFSGVLPTPSLRIQDDWQHLRVTLNSPGASEFWVAPIETVSESEEGFERVYQGSQILAVSRPDLASLKSWSTRLSWRVDPA